MEKEELLIKVRLYIGDALFGGDIPPDFDDETLLVSSRIMDSIVTLHLVNHFENLLNIEFEAHEVNADNLDSINLITQFLLHKMGN